MIPSEDTHDVQVLEGFGNERWMNAGVIGPGGSGPAAVDHDGPALEPGVMDQFRATSIKEGVPISSTEDPKGVFLYQ